MTGDGLHDPLGKPTAPAKSSRLPRRGAIAIVLGLAFAGLGFLAAHDDNGRGGEPFAVASIERPPAIAAKDGPRQSRTADVGTAAQVPAAPASNPSAAQTDTVAADARGQAVDSENGVKVVRAIRNFGPNSVVLKVPQAETLGLATAPDPRLTEASAFGLLPKTGPDGSRAADVYARPAGPASNKPKIAILIGGMGLDRAETAQAASSLPAAVTFGFAPYGPDLDQQVRQARESGHEVVLQLPMEDFGRSDANLSHMLTANPQGNDGRLRWLMGRFTGYAGVGNYLGGRVLGDEATLQPLLREIARRGLYFVDDGTAARSLVGPLAADVGLAAVRADVVIDAKPDPASMTLALHQLEMLARERGYALGMATGLPGTNAIIRRYTAGLGEGDVTLVPVSQMVKAEPQASAKNAP